MVERLALTAFVLLMNGSNAWAQGTVAAEMGKCQICHALDTAGGNRVGPNLHGIFGRKAGTVAGFNSSDAIKNSGIVWDDDTLTKFLHDPKEAVPGNRMSFPGIADDAVLRDLVQALKLATQ